MKVLCNGCSYTWRTNERFRQDKIRWPEILANKLPQHEFTNLAHLGAGNFYIKESTIDYIKNNDVDHVLIMWSGFSRYDVSVTQEQYDILNTGKKYRCKSSRDLWVSSGDMLKPLWVSSGGNSGAWKNWGYYDPAINDIIADCFEEYYKNINWLQHYADSLQQIIDVQQYCKLNNIPYTFMNYRNHLNKSHADVQKEKFNIDIADQFSFGLNAEPYMCDFEQLDNIVNQIDFDNWCFIDNNKNGIWELALTFPGRTGTYDDGDHPGTNTAELFVTQYLLPTLNW